MMICALFQLKDSYFNKYKHYIWLNNFRKNQQQITL